MRITRRSPIRRRRVNLSDIIGDTTSECPWKFHLIHYTVIAISTGMPFMLRKLLIILNSVFILWMLGVLFYSVIPGMSSWIMADIYVKYGFIAWATVNTGVLIQALATLGLFVQNRPLMNFTIPFLLFYGVGGLLVFNWSPGIIPMQILRLAMTLTVIYIVFTALKQLQLIKLAIWIVIGTIVFVGVNVYQNQYFKTHPEVANYLTVPVK